MWTSTKTKVKMLNFYEPCYIKIIYTNGKKKIFFERRLLLHLFDEKYSKISNEIKIF